MQASIGEREGCMIREMTLSEVKVVKIEIPTATHKLPYLELYSIAA